MIAKILSFLRRQRRRFKRLIAWLPIIWDDEEWDYEYLFKIMQFKISRMRSQMAKNNRHIGCEQQVKEMQRAEFLLSRISFSDFYFENNENSKNNDKQGKCSCPEVTMTFEQLPNGCSLCHFHYCEFCEKSFKHWYKREEAKERFDIQYTMNYIARKCQRWWD